MVIEIQLNEDGTELPSETKLYRDIHPGNITTYIQGFYANRPLYRWGRMTKITGKDRTTMRTFGNYASGETVTH